MATRSVWTSTTRRAPSSPAGRQRPGQADEQAGQMQDFMEAFERDSGHVIPDPTTTDPSRDDGGSFQRASEEKLRTRRVVRVADRFRSADRGNDSDSGSEDA